MTADADATPADQCAAAGVVLGLVGAVTCWWFPFGPLVGVVGVGCGLAGLLGGGGRLRAGVGTALSVAGAGAGVLLAYDYWWRVFGIGGVVG